MEEEIQDGGIGVYLAGRRLGEGEVDLGLDGEADVVGVKLGLPRVVGVDLGVPEHVADVAVGQVEELVHHPRLVLPLAQPHGAQELPHHARVAGSSAADAPPPPAAAAAAAARRLGRWAQAAGVHGVRCRGGGGGGGGWWGFDSGSRSTVD